MIRKQVLVSAAAAVAVCAALSAHTPASAAPSDVCAIVPIQQVQAILGHSTIVFMSRKMEASQGFSTGTCVYAARKTGDFSASVTIVVSSSRPLLQSMLDRMPKTKGVAKIKGSTLVQVGVNDTSNPPHFNLSKARELLGAMLQKI